ncbi:hypothetical protein Glove_311g33 [Diversispora epigaea]|uniref:Protein kinase domain-containing protein n=1 Tax=Diversispora epigaea TaxID=1348612 RepID=A0A397HRY3_9GLOM|nr:hypothetical protein Glove_311g33 [Diversispora epigaea]
MSQGKEEIVYCPAGHSYNNNNYINEPIGICDSCIKEHFIKEFKTWTSGNSEIDEIIQESQKNHQGCGYKLKLQWIPYDNFRIIKHIADGGYGSVYSSILKNGLKHWWNFNKQDWKYYDGNKKAALKEINYSRYDISKFLKEVKNIMIANDWKYIIRCFGFSKNPFTQNYIIVMDLYDDSLNKFITKCFLNLRWKSKIYLLNNIYGSIPYIPPEVLRGNVFTKKGDIYSFGGIMYEMATGKQPFHDRAHDTYLIIDICNGLRPKIPNIMSDWIPKLYSDLMEKCWSSNPSERPTSQELSNVFYNLFSKLRDNKIINDILQQFTIADENQEKAIKYQKQESSLSSSISHPQSCYISRSIHTLHGLHNSLEGIKSGKSQDPNLLKFNETSTSNVSIDPNELRECINWEKEIQNKAEKRSFSDNIFFLSHIIIIITLRLFTGFKKNEYLSKETIRRKLNRLKLKDECFENLVDEFF